MINGLKEEAKKFNKEPSEVSVYILTYLDPGFSWFFNSK